MYRTKVNRFAAAAVLLPICIFSFLLFRSSAPPTLGDFAEWSYHGVLFRNVLQGHPSGLYVLKIYPVPNVLSTVGLGLLMLLLPWKVAAKLWLVVQVSLGAIACYRLHAAADSRCNPGKAEASVWNLFVVPAAAIFGITFWAGFSNFMFGTFFAMLLCSMLVKQQESRWKCGALLVLTFFSHMIPFAFAILVLGLYAAQRGRGVLMWQAVPGLALSAWYFIGRALQHNADGRAGMVASVDYMTPMFVVFKANSFLKCWGFLNPALGPQDSVLLKLAGAKIFALLFLVNCGLASGMLVLLLAAVWRSLRARTEIRFFWLATAIFFGVSLLLPGAAAGISDPGGRMMQIAVWCGLCVAATRRRWAGTVLASCGTLLLVADCYLFAAVAMKPPIEGAVTGPIPSRIREFAHVYYADRWDYYSSLDDHTMDREIYPTAMFLKK